jgi:hypothetical protein
MYSINPAIVRCIEGKLALLCTSMAWGIPIDLVEQGRAIHFTVKSVECMRHGPALGPNPFHVSLCAQGDIETQVVDLLVAGIHLHNKQRV